MFSFRNYRGQGSLPKCQARTDDVVAHGQGSLPKCQVPTDDDGARGQGSLQKCQVPTDDDGARGQGSLPKCQVPTDDDGARGQGSLPKFQVPTDDDGARGQGSLPKFQVPTDDDGARGQGSLPKFQVRTDDVVARGQGSPMDALGEGDTVVELNIPGSKVGLIIGKGGENIRQLQERTGVSMVILQDSNAPSAHNKPLRITGDFAKCQRAKEMVLEFIAEKAESNAGGLWRLWRPFASQAKDVPSPRLCSLSDWSVNQLSSRTSEEVRDKSASRLGKRQTAEDSGETQKKQKYQVRTDDNDEEEARTRIHRGCRPKADIDKVFCVIS